MQYSELTEKIIGCAYNVYNKMGYGYLESVYDKCMSIELADIGLNVEVQKPLKVFYKEQVVGDFVADVIVNDTVILKKSSLIRKRKFQKNFRPLLQV